MTYPRDKAYPTSDVPPGDAVTADRERPCTKRTWCIGDSGHDGSCVEVPRYQMPPSDFGPTAAKARRW